MLEQLGWEQEPVKEAAPERRGEANEAIAIVAMACRFPGGAEDPETFWRLLSEGVDAIVPVPADRWNAEEYYDPEAGTPGKIITREGGFLRQVDGFDAQFFGISPREALSMDPQQRLLLETSLEALERAGQRPDRVGGSATGVFVGVTNNDYARLLMGSGEGSGIDPYFVTGQCAECDGRRSVLHSGVAGAEPGGGHGVFVVVGGGAPGVSERAERRMRDGGGGRGEPDPVADVEGGDVGAAMLSPDGRCKTFDAEAKGTCGEKDAAWWC